MGAYLMPDNYTRTAVSLPPEGVVVDTISEGGQDVRLKRIEKLWFFEDGSMYVYYTPIMWRLIPDA